VFVEKDMIAKTRLRAWIVAALATLTIVAAGPGAACEAAGWHSMVAQ